MSRLFIMHGLPGSGKSTAARKMVDAAHAEGRTMIRVNRDDLRTQVAGRAYHQAPPAGRVEKRVTALQHSLMGAALATGVDVVCDDTNLDARNVRSLLTLADESRAKVEHIYLDVPVSTCLQRVRSRAQSGGRPVPEDVVRAMAEKAYTQDRASKDGTVLPGRLKRFAFYKGQLFMVAPAPAPEVDEFNLELQKTCPVRGSKVALVDADGTLFANEADVQLYMKGRRKDFDSFYRAVIHAPVNQTVLAMTQDLRKEGVNIFLLTGRTDDYASYLIEALRASGAPVSRLLMKKEGDMRPSAPHKQEVMETLRQQGYTIVRAIDDRDQDLEMFLKAGVPVTAVASSVK